MPAQKNKNISSSERRKAYQKSRTSICLRLSPQEAQALEMMMIEEDWASRAGFIRYKLFGKDGDRRFLRDIHSGKTRNILSAFFALAGQMQKDLHYANIRYSMEIDEAKKSGKASEKVISALYGYGQRIQDVSHVCLTHLDEIAKALKLSLDNTSPEYIRCIPTEVLEQLTKSWNTDMHSPYLAELARRRKEEE